MFQYPKIDTIKTGKNIRKLCQEQNKTVSEIQTALHIGSNQAIYSWFNGRTMPSVDSLYALSCFLEVSIEEILVTK